MKHGLNAKVKKDRDIIEMCSFRYNVSQDFPLEWLTHKTSVHLWILTRKYVKWYNMYIVLFCFLSLDVTS